MNDDAELLRQYVGTRSQAAFTELVQRHIGLVYASACRRLNGDRHAASDVTQAVFTLLARSASRLQAHTALQGWLFTTTRNLAVKHVRAEQRRQAREQEAVTMQEDEGGNTEALEWTALRKVIDGALDSLSPTDRDAVLLRYFSGLSYDKIGQTMHIKEDAARMRVERALERLHRVLTKRGVTSAATATLLVQHASGAPAGLAAQVASTALSQAALLGAAGASAALFTMNVTSKVLLATSAIGIGLTGFQAYQLNRAHAESAQLNEENTQLRQRVERLEKVAQENSRRWQDAEADNEKLLEAVGSAQNTIAAAKTLGEQADAPLTRASVQTRFRQAQQLARNGDWPKALSEFLWCYDIGMRRVSSFAGVRQSFVLSEIAKMAKSYGPAREALVSRRDSAEKRFLADAEDSDALFDLASLNRALGDQQRNLALFDSMKPDDRNRSYLESDVVDTLVEAKRYEEIAKARSYAKISLTFDSTVRAMDKMQERSKSAVKRQLLARAAQDIEILAGAGDLAHAQQHIERFTRLDGSPEARAILEKHLTRAGHPELLPKP